MASHGSITTINPIDQVSSPHILSSSHSSLSHSLSSSRRSSQISKTYRQASTLFLTRRLPESLSTILPVITPSSSSDTENTTPDDPAKSSAPISKASRTTRIKVWSLYLTILNAILELDPAEGKQAFGTSQFRALVAKVRDGEVWEEVVRNGYHGIEGDVDSDVVINLATLLLAHARSQKVNQTRLETYLATSDTISLSMSQSSTPTTSNPFPGSKRRSQPETDTPRDLNARVKILELYTLHVLLRNNEWDYAKEFITISEVLDDERREAFLGALRSLKEESEEGERRERMEKEYREEQLKKDIEESRRRREEEERRREEIAKKAKASARGTSEIDFGVEDEAAAMNNGSVTSSSAPNNPRQSKISKSSSTKPHSRKSIEEKKQKTMVEKMGIIMRNLKLVLENIGGSLNLKNPMVMLRMVAFVIGILVVFGRKEVRERTRRMMSEGLGRVKKTIGMGVKVSYI
ncbi:hypothetical protein sscle_14g097580 [Sclerotinia sclerotiorum 1980 UF-70]|uniref:Peroxin 26 n=1 Tax=Sclerotinia sclerotiorum (strain ATCC 18683 / 1980 / Ss-1) TaxID=665079 RepID=A0A1D9QJ87_SCLS1|nr:hypothetical protein sscle_14g097580 [Sclerotinia sclerotiorum 1980 UF-70]